MRLPKKLVHLAIVFLFCTSSLPAQCVPATLTLIAHREFATAKRTLDAQLRATARNDSALHCFATLALETDDQAGAVDYLERAIAIAPRPEHRVALAMALRLQASQAGMFSAGRLMTRMKTQLETALSGDSSLVDAHFVLLQLYAQAPAAMGGDIALARTHAAALLRFDPARGHVGRGYLAEQEKNPGLAEKEYRLATTIHPDSEVAYTFAAAFFRRQQRWNDAVAMYEKAVRTLSRTTLASRRANIHYLLGNSLEKAGNSARARAEYAEALKHKPDHADARKALGEQR
jgi:tetratricopeptide (TPR) repeat protein